MIENLYIPPISNTFSIVIEHSPLLSTLTVLQTQRTRKKWKDPSSGTLLLAPCLTQIKMEVFSFFSFFLSYSMQQADIYKNQSKPTKNTESELQYKIKRDADLPNIFKKQKRSQARLETNLEAVISPTTKFHDTGLLVKREILHVYLTGGFINGRRFPFD